MPGFSYIEQAGSWTRIAGHLDEKLHFTKPGNEVLARRMVSAISYVVSCWTPRVTTCHPADTSQPNHAPTSLSQLSSSCSHRHHQPPELTYSISNSLINYHRCHRPRFRFHSSPLPPATRTQPSSLSHQSTQALPSSSSPQLSSRRPTSRNRRSMTGSQRCWLISTFLLTFCIIFLKFGLGNLGVGKERWNVKLYAKNNFIRENIHPWQICILNHDI